MHRREEIGAVGIRVECESGGKRSKTQACREIEGTAQFAGGQWKEVVHEGSAGEQVDGPPFQPAGTGTGHGESNPAVLAKRALDAAMHDVEEGRNLLNLVDHDPFSRRRGGDDFMQRSRPEAVTVFRFGIEQIDPDRGPAREPLAQERRFPRAAGPRSRKLLESLIFIDRGSILRQCTPIREYGQSALQWVILP